ncbi:FIST signal transduction protein [Methanopyrus sp.]
MKREAIEVGVAYGKDPYTVVEDAMDQLTGPPNFGLVFFSPRHVDEIESAISNVSAECRIIGCSTAGELTPDGYTSGTVTVTLIHSPYLSVETNRVTFEREDPEHAKEIGRNLVLGAMEKLRDPGPCLDINFNTMLRSLREGKPVKVLPYFMIELVEGLVPAIDYYMDGINEMVRKYKFLEVYGGAAGDDLRLERTYVLEGRTLCPEGSAVIAFGSTALKIGGALECGFEPVYEDKFPITKALPEERRIVEFDGEPAAEYYSEVVGEDVERLDDSVFMWNPLGWEIFGREIIVREPAFVEDDGSMVFHSRPPAAGTLIRLEPTKENMRETARRVTERAMNRADIRDPEEIALVLVFDCAHRDCDEQYDAIREVVGDDVPVVGFKTYGEHGQLETGPAGHFNQTIEVVVIGRTPVSR